MINDPLDCSDVICTPIVTNTLLPILEMLLSELQDTQFTKVKSASWFNLPFTEVMITDVCRLVIKINQSKRAWCRSHALNFYLIPQSPSLLTKPTTYPIMSSIMCSGSILFGDMSETYLHFLTPYSIIWVLRQFVSHHYLLQYIVHRLVVPDPLQGEQFPQADKTAYSSHREFSNRYKSWILYLPVICLCK